MKEEKCNKNGITLIALVITIIILLILAGVAVSIGLNGNNMFEKANEAKTSWNDRVNEEQTNMKSVVGYIGVNIPEELQVGDTVNWTPSGHYTWDARYYKNRLITTPFLVTKELYTGEQVPNDAIESWPQSSAVNNINMTISSWKVLKIDRNTNIVTLVPSAPTNAMLLMGGAQGYNNSLKLLNDACSALYGNDIGVKARNINKNDLLNFMTSDEAKTIIEQAKNSADTDNHSNAKYGEKPEESYTVDKKYPTIFEEEEPSSISPIPEYSGRLLGNSDARDTFIEPENDAKVAGTSLYPTNTKYKIGYDDLETALGEYFNLLLPGMEKETKNVRYWLATRSVILMDNNSNCVFCIEIINGYGCSNMLGTINSSGAERYYDASLFPYVEISSGTISTPVNHICTYEPLK